MLLYLFLYQGFSSTNPVDALQYKNKYAGEEGPLLVATRQKVMQVINIPVRPVRETSRRLVIGQLVRICSDRAWYLSPKLQPAR